MMRLRHFFEGVAAKRLRSVEADPLASNQHEFNGVSAFRNMLGIEHRCFSTLFLYLDDDDDQPLMSHGQTTWYDARENNPNRSPEYRLYFRANGVSARFAPGDLMISALRPDGHLLVIVVPPSSTVAAQLLWLFGLDPPNGHDIVRSGDEIDRDVGYAERWILHSLGIEVPVDEMGSESLDTRFPAGFPSTKEFSAFAREMAPVCDPVGDPDHAIMVWLETEERLFRSLERSIVTRRLRDGFLDGENEPDVEAFIQYSLSVQNRRKSRAGFSLEHHVEEILSRSALRFERGVVTEARCRPDFLFPGQREYRDPEHAAERLAVLGVKATCKDRWRQILSEAERIPAKHLLTLEPGISLNQTSEMRDRQVQLVVPESLHPTFADLDQRLWLWNLRAFIDFVRELQS